VTGRVDAPAVYFLGKAFSQSGKAIIFCRQVQENAAMLARGEDSTVMDHLAT
jgi:hypothetical protein